MATLPNLGVSNMVKSSTSTIAQAFTTTSSALDMLSAYVENAKIEQIKKHATDAVAFETELMSRVNIRMTEAQENLETFANSSARRGELVQSNMEKLQAAIDAAMEKRK